MGSLPRSHGSFPNGEKEGLESSTDGRRNCSCTGAEADGADGGDLLEMDGQKAMVISRRAVRPRPWQIGEGYGGYAIKSGGKKGSLAV